jgi:hypothetical protein
MADNISTTQQGVRRAGEMSEKKRKETMDGIMAQIQQAPDNIAEVERAIQKYFGDDRPFMAALLGNIHVESGGSYTFDKKQDDGGPGRGIFQFDFHKPYYQKYLKGTGLKDSVDTQVRYVRDVLYRDEETAKILGRNVVGANKAKKIRGLLKSTNDPYELSGIFLDEFLRPGKPHREKRMLATKAFVFKHVPAK